jgi:hypothetical protein
MSSILLWSFLLANLAYGEAFPLIWNPGKPHVQREDSPQLYNLPYGAIGFVSHIITLYTLICLWHCRRPLNPWKPLGNHSWLRRIIGMLTSVASITFAAFTIVWCSNGTGLLVMQGLLNASLSVLLGCTTSSAGSHITEPNSSSPASNDTDLPQSQTFDTDSKSVLNKPVGSFASSVLPTENSPVPSPDSAESRTNSSQSKPRRLWYVVWVILYFPFAILGLVSPTIQINGNWDNHAVQLVTVAVVSVTVCWSVFWIAAAVFAASKDPQLKMLPLLCMIIPFGLGISVMIFSPFYSDWVLGAVTGNFAGLPISKNAVNFVVYWGYFIANLFPLACM